MQQLGTDEAPPLSLCGHVTRRSSARMHHGAPVTGRWTLSCFLLFSLSFPSRPLSLNLSFSLPSNFLTGDNALFFLQGSPLQSCKAHSFLRKSTWSLPRISAACESHPLAIGSTVPHSKERLGNPSLWKSWFGGKLLQTTVP